MYKKTDEYKSTVTQTFAITKLIALEQLYRFLDSEIKVGTVMFGLIFISIIIPWMVLIFAVLFLNRFASFYEKKICYLFSFFINISGKWSFLV